MPSTEEYEKNRDYYVNKSRQWRSNNRKRHRAYSSKYQTDHPEKHLLATKKSYRKHQEQNRSSFLKRRYGITWEDKVAWYEKQKGLCKCCGTPLPPVDDQKCHIDHDHVTLEIRGLVHFECNLAISWVENKEHLLKQAVIYLKKYKLSDPIQTNLSSTHRPEMAGDRSHTS